MQQVGEKMQPNRTILVQLVMLFIFLLFICRLWWIQVIGGIRIPYDNTSIIEASIGQRGSGIVLDSGRGHFLDREQRPLTGEVYWTLAVFPIEQHDMDIAKLQQLARLLNTTPQQWVTWQCSLQEPTFWPEIGMTPSVTTDSNPVRLRQQMADEIAKLHIPGLVVVPYMNRYEKDQPASQLIGFIGQNPDRVRQLYKRQVIDGDMTLSSRIGVSGLEKTFDAFLQPGNTTVLKAFMDSHRHLVNENSFRLYRENNPYLPVQIMTTIDVNLQRAVDDLMERYLVQKGAVVVLDAIQGDVVVMSNSPSFQPTQVNLESEAWINHAVKQEIPGSIFKTVVAAAALEYGIAQSDDVFFCSGTYGRYGLDCWDKEGHGHLDLSEAFAHSCNVIFAKLMEKISAEQLISTANKLGLETTIGWQGVVDGQVMTQLDGEESGQLFAAETDREDGGVLAQTAIGQRDVRMSPLQAANMMLGIANRGQIFRPRVVSEIRYNNGVIMKQFPVQVYRNTGEGISAETADALGRWLRLVVEEGTGQHLQHMEWKVAGKSGTAEVPGSNGVGENEWFVGYGPVDLPRYSVAVFIHKSVQDDVHTATHIFADVMNLLANS